MKNNFSFSRLPQRRKFGLLFKTITLVGLSTSQYACAPPGLHHVLTSGELATKTVATVGCPNFEDDFWDNLYTLTLDQQTFPSPDDVRRALGKTLSQGRMKTRSNAERDQLGEALTRLYRTVAVDSIRILNGGMKPSADRALEILTALELGDRSTPERDALQTKIRSEFTQVRRLAETSRSSCPSSKPNPINDSTPDGKTMLGHWKATRPPLVYGALKALATAYQSCEVGALKPVDATVPDAEGISIVGNDVDGIGKIRKITDLDRLLRTDYYLENHHAASATCFAVEESPMIYNYGGKPAATSSDVSTLDFFHRAGTGGNTLGIDCSAYVYSSLATAGLKVKKSGRLKAIDVHGVSSAMFNNPGANGLTCLSRAQFSSSASLRAGDIIAEDGHVVIVASVGADPYGISGLNTEGQCKAASIDPRRYDFTILQSSTSLAGIGINRIQASTYFSDDGPMARGVVDQAVTACLARVRSSTIATKSLHANVVRHNGSSECVDTPIALSHEACIASCEAIE